LKRRAPAARTRRGFRKRLPTFGYEAVGRRLTLKAQQTLLAATVGSQASRGYVPGEREKCTDAPAPCREFPEHGIPRRRASRESAQAVFSLTKAEREAHASMLNQGQAWPERIACLFSTTIDPPGPPPQGPPQHLQGITPRTLSAPAARMAAQRRASGCDGRNLDEVRRDQRGRRRRAAQGAACNGACRGPRQRGVNPGASSAARGLGLRPPAPADPSGDGRPQPDGRKTYLTTTIFPPPIPSA